jgi:hypothetical protein
MEAKRVFVEIISAPDYHHPEAAGVSKEYLSRTSIGRLRQSSTDLDIRLINKPVTGLLTRRIFCLPAVYSHEHALDLQKGCESRSPHICPIRIENRFSNDWLLDNLTGTWKRFIEKHTNAAIVKCETHQILG